MKLDFYDWVFDKLDDDKDPPVFNFGCNHDVMIHSGKGLLGLRVDAVYDVEISNIFIYNLYEKHHLVQHIVVNIVAMLLVQVKHQVQVDIFDKVTQIQTAFTGNML